MKKTSIVIVVVVVLAAAVAIWKLPRHQQRASQSQQTKQFDPKNPNFVTGMVVSAAADELILNSNGGKITADLSPSTKLVKQVKDAKGVISVTSALLSDFKPKALVVVYFSSPASNGVYMADKVQVISN